MNEWEAMTGVVHFCVDCGHDQDGTLNLTTGWWHCSICRHTANLNHGLDDNDITGAAV